MPTYLIQAKLRPNRQKEILSFLSNAMPFEQADRLVEEEITEAKSNLQRHDLVVGPTPYLEKATSNLRQLYLGLLRRHSAILPQGVDLRVLFAPREHHVLILLKAERPLLNAEFLSGIPGLILTKLQEILSVGKAANLTQAGDPDFEILR